MDKTEIRQPGHDTTTSKAAHAEISWGEGGTQDSAVLEKSKRNQQNSEGTVKVKCKSKDSICCYSCNFVGKMTTQNKSTFPKVTIASHTKFSQMLLRNSYSFPFQNSNWQGFPGNKRCMAHLMCRRFPLKGFAQTQERDKQKGHGPL